MSAGGTGEAGEAGDAVPTLDFLGLRYTALELEATRRLLVARRPNAPFAYVVTPNAQHLVRLSRGDPNYIAGYADAWLRLGDSRVGQILAARLFGLHLPLVRGSDLTAALLADGVRPDDPVTVIGGDAALAEKLRCRYGLRHLALYQPAMGLLRDPAARQACVDFVLAHPARYVFLAVGAPPSELIAAQIRAAGATGTGLCIGSSLHFAVGLVRRAPVWMQRCWLEWAYRLMQSPRGHFRRVFHESVPMVWLLLRTRFGDPEPLRRARSGGG